MAKKDLKKRIIISYSLLVSLIVLSTLLLSIFYLPQKKTEAASQISSLSSVQQKKTTAKKQEFSHASEASDFALSIQTNKKNESKTSSSSSSVSSPASLSTSSQAAEKLADIQTILNVDLTTAIASAEKEQDLYSSQNSKTNIPSKEEPTVTNGKKYKLYIVLDDCGGDLKKLSKFLALPFDITYAVIPFLAHSTESAKRIHEKGREVIVHQPMEPLSGNPGEGAIFTGMQKDAIISQLEASFKDVPFAKGLNNHMGSKATADEDVMSVLLEHTSNKGRFFLDSKTSANVVGEKLALKYNCPYTQRNAMFLDNEKDSESLEIAIKSGLQTAKKNGHAIMIGHVVTTQLADLLLKLYPSILEEGFEFEKLSDFFTNKDEELF